MKILIVGAAGTIGKHLVKHFDKEHEVVSANRTSGDIRIDITSEKSIVEALNKVGPVDAIVVAAGEARWEPMEKMSEADYYVGIKSKLMGQVNIVRLGMKSLSAGGSVTLTTGILAVDPVDMTTSAAMVNGAIHSFVLAAALEMHDGKRINVVCPGLVEDSVEKYADYFPGHNPVPMEKVVNGYVRSVLGKGNGEIIEIYE